MGTIMYIAIDVDRYREYVCKVRTAHLSPLARSPDSERMRVATFFIISQLAELRAAASLRRAEY